MIDDFMIKGFTFLYKGHDLACSCISAGVAAQEHARPSNAAWKFAYQSHTTTDLPWDPADTEESVKARAIAWAAAL